MQKQSFSKFYFILLDFKTYKVSAGDIRSSRRGYASCGEKRCRRCFRQIHAYFVRPFSSLLFRSL